jgi:hypothetical protein
MRYFTFFFILFFFKPSFSQTGTHTVQSSCTAHDTIKQRFLVDAGRLAVRRAFHINSTYKDSVTINSSLKNRYLGALLAIYNATAIPQRDTLIDSLKIHTDLNPELRLVSIKAPASYAWMDSLSHSSTVTNNQLLDNLITQYNMIVWAYYVSSAYDQAVFMAGMDVNTQALANRLAGISGVIDADPEPGFSDVTNITDSLTNSYIIFTFSAGWGTCYNGCDYRRYWNIKVDTNCVVEFRGSTGDLLKTALKENFIENNLKAYPNPFSEKIVLENSGNTPLKVEVQNVLGEPLFELNLESKIIIDTPGLAPGIYFITIKGNDLSKTIKVIKDR